MRFNPQWLELVREDALEPGLEIVDTHIHLWDDEKVEIYGLFMVDELIAEIQASGHNVTQLVHVESSTRLLETGPDVLKPLGETQFIEAAADELAQKRPNGPAMTGIVGKADLGLGSEVREVLEAHRAASPTRFRGIRYQASWDAELPPLRNRTGGMLANPKVREGLATLADMGLVLDTHVLHPQLPDLVDLARAVPQASIVLDHIGTPLGVARYEGKPDQTFDEWRSGMAELAKCENVSVKLGGMLLPRWTGLTFEHRDTPPTSAELADVTRRYYLTAIELFSAARCMFQSNFPVERASASYGVLWNSLKRVTSDLSEADRAALFSGTAKRVYRLA